MVEKIGREEALAVLNDFFSDDLEPVEMEQVYPLNALKFKRWVRKSSLAKKQKARLLRVLKPLIDKEAVVAGVVFRGATLVEDGSEVNVAVLGIPEAFRPRLHDTDVFVVYADSGETDSEDPEDPEGPEGPGDGGGDDGGPGNEQEHCRYNRCMRASKSDTKPWCVRAYMTNKECPPDECSGDEDCGGGVEDDDNILDFFEVLSAF